MIASIFPVLAGLLLVLGVAAAALFFVLAPGPRRTRGYNRAAQLLNAGDWQQALSTVRDVLNQGSHPPEWERKLRTLEGKCLHAAGDASLAQGRFEEANQHYQQAAPLLGLDAGSLRDRVVESMLGHVRAHLSAGNDVRELLERTLRLQPASAEVSFWKAICAAREGPVEQAVALLDQAHQLGNRQHIDPPLYMGVLLHRQGKPQEALRILAEANRVDAGCPFVAWQMGLSMLASGGDNNMAIRVLQKAVGPKGLGLWAPSPQRAWVEAFPTGRSFVRKLAEKHAFSDPVLGGDLRVLIRQAETALGQAYYRQGSFQEAADVYHKLLQETAPTLPVLRGLGLSLTRLGRYDQAFKHLRAALEMEPNNGLTAGYLALCGAKGRPQQAEDRPKNVAWAVRQVSRFDGTGNAEYAAIMSAVHAEARSLNLEIGREDQGRLCGVLASVKAHDAESAAGYLHQSRQYHDDVRDENAWLFGRAAVAHGVSGDGELDLLARVFRNRDAARDYYARQGWELEEVEQLYLERHAARHPGSFPAVLGADYPPRGEKLLLERSAWLEGMNDLDGALNCVTVLLHLAPRSVAAHDRAACLHFRRDERLQALSLLEAWQKLEPDDALPVVRRAVLEQQMGQAEACLASLERALALANGTAKASVAFLGARLMLARWTADGSNPQGLEQAEAFLRRCLREQSNHPDALWVLAALRAMRGDAEGLAALAPTMNRPEVREPRFHLLAAVCLLLNNQAEESAAAAARAAASPELAPEGQFVLAWAHLRRGDENAARKTLQLVAAGQGPSTDLARAMLGRLHFQSGGFAEAVQWWAATEAGKRAEWQLDEPLRQTVLLAGVAAFRAGQFEQAAERFREAGRLGLRDRRLGPLIGLSLFKAGQRLLFQE